MVKGTAYRAGLPFFKLSGQQTCLPVKEGCLHPGIRFSQRETFLPGQAVRFFFLFKFSLAVQLLPEIFFQSMQPFFESLILSLFFLQTCKNLSRIPYGLQLLFKLFLLLLFL